MTSIIFIPNRQQEDGRLNFVQHRHNLLINESKKNVKGDKSEAYINRSNDYYTTKSGRIYTERYVADLCCCIEYQRLQISRLTTDIDRIFSTLEEKNKEYKNLCDRMKAQENNMRVLKSELETLKHSI